MGEIWREIKQIQKSEFSVPKAHIGILILFHFLISVATLGRIEALKDIVNLIGGRHSGDTILRHGLLLVGIVLLAAALRFALARYLLRCKDRAFRRYVRVLMDRNLFLESWKDARTGAPDRYVIMTRTLRGYVDSIYRSVPDFIAWAILIPLFSVYLGTVSMVALAVAIAVELAVWKFSGRIQKLLPELNRDRRGKYGKWMNFLNRTFVNLDVMRSSVSQKRYEGIFDRKAYCWNDSSIQGLERLLTMDQIQNAGGIFIETVLLFIGVVGLLTGRYEVGGVYALVASVQAIKGKFAEMPVIVEEVYESRSHHQMLAEFCGENAFAGEGGSGAAAFEELELKEVSFGYRNAGQIIDKLFFSFKKGNMYAIVGEAGTGKTTVLLMIARLLQETGGELCYNGQNIREINRESLWKQLIYVSEPCFIQGTVEKNIRFGRETFDACLYREIAGWDGQLLGRTVEDEEVGTFSAGEKQRIMIYRALCSGCSLMLLDEPFSNLDQAMERKMIELMERSVKDGKCIIFTTHRGAVLKKCAGILSMGNGGKI